MFINRVVNADDVDVDLTQDLIHVVGSYLIFLFFVCVCFPTITVRSDLKVNGSW